MKQSCADLFIHNIALRRDNDLGAIHNILEAGYPNIPQPSDAEK